MRLPVVRVTVRGMMAAVALVGLNLSAARHTERVRSRMTELCAASAGNLFQTSDGSVLLQPGRKGNVFRVVHPPTARGLIRTWWAVGASAGLTVVATLFASRPSARRRPRT